MTDIKKIQEALKSLRIDGRSPDQLHGTDAEYRDLGRWIHDEESGHEREEEGDPDWREDDDNMILAPGREETSLRGVQKVGLSVPMEEGRYPLGGSGGEELDHIWNRGDMKKEIKARLLRLATFLKNIERVDPLPIIQRHIATADPLPRRHFDKLKQHDLN